MCMYFVLGDVHVLQSFVQEQDTHAKRSEPSGNFIFILSKLINIIMYVV